MKRSLFTFDEDPSPAALPVVVVHLDERTRCHHVIGHQRGGSVQIGGCGSRTVADGDRIQRASISRAHAGLSDSMAPWILLCSAAPATSSSRSCKTKEHRTRD